MSVPRRDSAAAASLSGRFVEAVKRRRKTGVVSRPSGAVVGSDGAGTRRDVARASDSAMIAAVPCLALELGVVSCSPLPRT